jgi:uncharacterized ion transporter superfamily protein YfcC
MKSVKDKGKNITQPHKDEASAQGLKIDRKTVITITALLLGIMMFAGILTQFVPRGEYERYPEGSQRAGEIICDIKNGVEPNYVTNNDYKMPIWKVFTSVFEVFGSDSAVMGIAIICFIVLIGGTFLVLDRSGVLKYIMSTIVKKYSDKKYKLLAVMVLACMALSSVCGVLEESITLVPLAVAISLALGWDSLVGLGFSLVSIAFGYSAATFNPFNVGIVQSMAGLRMFSGLGYRLVVFAVVYTILTLFLIRYAKKIEKNPKKSIVYQTDLSLREKYSGVDEGILLNPSLKKASITFVGCVAGVLVCAALSFGLQMIDSIPDSIKTYIGYLPMVGMAVLFTVGGLRAGSIAGIKGKKIFGGFADGVKAIAPVVPMIIFVMSITFILQEGKIIDTILHYLYEGLKGFSPSSTLLLFFLFIIILEFFIGSGTAKAFLVMPLVLPLADMLLVTRQSIALSFSLADGFCNIFYPTSGVLILAIGIVNVSYGKFMRWMWKLFAAEFFFAALILLGAVAIGYK